MAFEKRRIELHASFPKYSNPKHRAVSKQHKHKVVKECLSLSHELAESKSAKILAISNLMRCYYHRVTNSATQAATC